MERHDLQRLSELGHIHQALCSGDLQYLVDVVANSADFPDEHRNIHRRSLLYLQLADSAADEAGVGHSSLAGLLGQVVKLGFGEPQLKSACSGCQFLFLLL